MQQVTRELPALSYQIPPNVAAIRSVGPSEEGHSVYSSRLLCPEFARLMTAGVYPKRIDQSDSLEKEYLVWGSIIHSIRAVRIVYGHARALQFIGDLDLSAEDKLTLLTMWKIYESVYPLADEPFKYLAVEAEVWTDIGDGHGGQLLRSVRYDSVIKGPGDGVFSFECKSSARSGQSVLDAYRLQFTTQTAFWNRNQWLVDRYGPMKGVLCDMIIKTQVPKVDRIGPLYQGNLAELRTVEYYRLLQPNRAYSAIELKANPDGSHPRFLSNCWGRYRACMFVGLCWEGAVGAYEIRGRG